jgi:hypothetical protein
MGGYDEEESDAEIDEELGGSDSDASGAPQVMKKTTAGSAASGGQPLRPIAGHTPMEIFAGGVAGASIGTAAAAMIVAPSNIVFVAGGLSW